MNGFFNGRVMGINMLCSSKYYYSKYIYYVYQIQIIQYHHPPIVEEWRLIHPIKQTL
jgi:hypothetical protein